MDTEANRLTLFVTGDAPRSRRARANLAQALDEAGKTLDSVTEVDLLQSPQQGLDHGIFATPALMLTGRDADVRVMYGDLSDGERLRALLNDIAVASG